MIVMHDPNRARPPGNRAIQVQGHGAAETDLLTTRWSECPMPELPPGGALLRVTGCGLCGTDVEKLARHRLDAGAVLGHEVVGVIEALDASPYDVPFKVGDRLVVAHHVPCQHCHYCMAGSPSMCRQFKATNFAPGGFAQWIALSGLHLRHTAFVIPPHISDREAACIEPLACVVRAVQRVPNLSALKSAAVIGMGFIGMLAGQTFQQFGLKTLGVDINPCRLAIADVAGMVDAVYMPAIHETLLEEFLASQTATGGVDVVCLTVLNDHAVKQALRLVRDGGWIILLAGSQASTEGELAGDVLYHREVSLITSYSPSLDSLRLAKDWVFERKVRLNPMITHPLPIEAFNDGVDLYRSGEAIKVFYHFPEAGPPLREDVAWPLTF